jgi:biotin carboxylase
VALIQIVGGGINQVALVNRVQAMGHKALVTDMFPNPPCASISDHFRQIDTTDRLGNLSVARDMHIDAILCDQTDAAVPTVAFVAQEMGLRGIGTIAAQRFSNKLVSREYLSRITPELIPEYQYFDSYKEAATFLSAASKTYVVKPINSQGSKGVARVTKERHADQLLAAFKESRGKGILLEEEILGREFSVEAYTQAGYTHNLALTSKYHYPHNDCIDVRNTYLADVPAPVVAELFAANSKIVRALGLDFGSTHAEYMWTGEKVVLMEIAARGGGGGISSLLVPYLTDFSPNEALIKDSLGESHDIRYRDYQSRFAILKFFELKPGTLKSVRFRGDADPNLLYRQITVSAGEEIRVVKDSRDRAGFFIVKGDTAADAIEAERRIEQSLEATYV